MKIPEERIWILLARKFSDSITDAEDAELRELLRYHSDAQYTFGILEKIWKVPPASVGEDTNLYLNKILASMQDGPAALKYSRYNRRVIKHVMMAACMLLIAGSLFYGAWYMFSVKSKAGIHSFYTISTKAGEKKKITLPDGTRVWLNVASSISYPVGFITDSIRSLRLTGEAYFEVKHDKKHPFIIHTRNMDIRDIGTAFNVKSYREEAYTEATLISGIIEVTVRNNPEKIRLQPEEKIVVYQNKHFEKYSKADSLKVNPPVQDIQVSGYRIIPIKVDSAIRTFPETAWMQNDFVFKNQTFEELANAMERRYAVRIIIADNNIKQYQLTGIFKNETVEQALEELQVIAPFKYTIKDSIITIF